ncbi:hypothetical protein MD484_g8681, partial [Candolleomyces efflorescens]
MFLFSFIPIDDVVQSDGGITTPMHLPREDATVGTAKDNEDNATVSVQEPSGPAPSHTQVLVDIPDENSEPDLDWLIQGDESDGADEEAEQRSADNPSFPLLKLPVEIMGNIADEMSTSDFANLLKVNVQLKKILLLAYMKRVGLTAGSSKISIQGQFPLSAVRLLRDLPPFHSSRTNFECELYFIHSFPAAIARFLQNQPHITRVRIRYSEHYAIFVTHPRLPVALQHTLTSLGPSFKYLEVDSKPAAEPSVLHLPSQGDHADLPAQVSPMSSITHLRWFNLAVSFLIYEPVCQIFLSLLSSRTDATLLVSDISNARELKELFLKLPRSTIGYLALFYIGSERPVVPDSVLCQFANLHTFWFYHPYYVGIEPVALRLPPLKALTLTPCFSTIYMTDSSTLKQVHLTPCSFYDTEVSTFCKQLDNLCQLINIVFRSLNPTNVSLQLDLPSSLIKHFSAAKRELFTCFCWQSLHFLTDPPIRSVSTLRLNMDSPDVFLGPDWPEIISFLHVFTDVESVDIHVSDYCACNENSARSLLPRLQSELSAITQLTLGPVYVGLLTRI